MSGLGDLPPMTRAELINRVRAHKRSMSRAWGVWLVVFLGIVLANIPIGKARRADPSSGVWVTLHVLSLVVVAAAVWFLVYFWRSKARHYGLTCPLCEKAIVGEVAQAAEVTGRCPDCGIRIVDEEPDDEYDDSEEQEQPEDELDEQPEADEAVPSAQSDDV
jgi:hypothetical protein